MAIKDVDTKCYILALFIRSDGERFLLGSGRYEFVKKQMHFSANTIANDVVEIQGNDGYLLAGQVRRPGTQNFDGYVGTGTTSKTDVESYRRAFFKFFRKNFLYKVIYVFPDGSAIQRKRGFLVDAPTVQELYQMYPEYHVALNFEDINYYYYNEDADGNEIYGKSALIGLSIAATGGLIWDALGAVSIGYTWSEPVEMSGSELVINNQLNMKAPITDLTLKGDTFQQTYSGKNLFSGNFAQFDSTGGSGSTYSYFELPSEDNYVITLIAKNDIPVQSSSKYLGFTKQGGSASGGYKWVFNADSTATKGQHLTVTNTYQGSYLNYLSIYHADATTLQWFTDNFDIQLEKGSSATSFEPYVGGIASPNPDYPQDIDVVTGEQTVTVNGGDNQSQSYTVDLGSIELCKIGNYQDYIYKSGDDWYVHKDIGKSVLNGSEGWVRHTFVVNNITGFKLDVGAANSDGGVLANYFNPVTWSSYQSSGANGRTYGTITTAETAPNTNIYISQPNSTITDLAQFQTWLSTHNTITYYPLATPTDTKITDNTLIGELEALGAMKLFIGENNLTVSPNSTNLPAILDFKYYTAVSSDGIGYEWEPGEAGGSKVIMIDSIDDVYPLLTITGPAVNPIITNITTGSIFKYNGTVTSSQVLKVDMMNKTATLNGASVIGNVSQDWLYFKPGDNRVEYTTTNSDSPKALIEWQEIVG